MRIVKYLSLLLIVIKRNIAAVEVEWSITTFTAFDIRSQNFNDVGNIIASRSTVIAIKINTSEIRCFNENLSSFNTVDAWQYSIFNGFVDFTTYESHI